MVTRKRKHEHFGNFPDEEEVPSNSSGSRALESSTARTTWTTAESQLAIRGFGVGIERCEAARIDEVLLGHLGAGVFGADGWFRPAPREDDPSETDHATQRSQRPPQANPRT